MLYNLRSGSWLAWANDTALHYTTIYVCNSEQLDPQCSKTDIPPSRSTTQGLCPIARKPLLISRLAEGTTLSWHKHTVGYQLAQGSKPNVCVHRGRHPPFSRPTFRQTIIRIYQVYIRIYQVYIRTYQVYTNSPAILKTTFPKSAIPTLDYRGLGLGLPPPVATRRRHCLRPFRITAFRTAVFRIVICPC